MPGDTYSDNRHSNQAGIISGGTVTMTTNTGSTAEGAAENRPLPTSRKVFVVHGRDDQARRAVFEFLRALELRPLEWEEIVAATGKAAPHVLEVVRHGFRDAQAVVVILTPDDVVELHESLREPADLEFERRPQGQPRPNALFEAGMAMAMHEHRTVLLQIGRIRPFSDLHGLDFVQLDGSPSKLLNVADRLRVAGCEVNTAGREWLAADRFTDLDAWRRSSGPRA